MPFRVWGTGGTIVRKKVEEGTFVCPNPSCKGTRESQEQTYRLRQERTWVSILYIPVCPAGSPGFFVECRSCKHAFPRSVLNRGMAFADAGPPAGPSRGITGITGAAGGLGSGAPSAGDRSAAETPTSPEPRTPSANEYRSGWYVDPYGDTDASRYWDGKQWTDHTAPRTSRSAS
jgi:hypothetical protein